MDIQFEIDGAIVDMADLLSVLENPTLGRVLRQSAEWIDQQVAPLCQQHGEFPAVMIVITDKRVTGVRVAGCCQPFVDLVQAQVEAVFVAQTPRLLPSNRLGMALLVKVQGADKVFAFDMARINQLIIGRRDPHTGYRPDIDLTTFDAYENGVSRRHATIALWNRGLFLMDTGSPNGTFLNEERLLPNDPCPLKFGDTIRIGRLVLEVTLDYPG